MPYWRLSGFYFFYFASLGALLPYWSLYLKQIGFDPLQIGELMAVLMATRIVAPNLWGWVADRSGRRMQVVRLGSLLGLIAFCGVFLARSYWPLAAVMFTFSFFWNAALPQFEANTLSHLGDDTHRYSNIRLWGSIGFILSVTALGALLQHHSPTLLPVVLMALFGGIWLASMVVPDGGVVRRGHDHVPLRRILMRPPVAALLVVSFLVQASHGPYYTFYTLYMEGFGYSRSAIGQLWALGVVAEVGIFLVMHRLVPRFGLRRLLLASLALTVVRWLAIGLFPTHLAVILAAQTLHAASFGVYHAVAIALIQRYFLGPHIGQGQALYSSFSFGAGGAFGSYYAGAVWGTLGPAAAFVMAAALALAAFAITARWIRD